METKSPHVIERFNEWLKESISVKLASIGVLVLLLLIPSSWLQSLMEERQYRSYEVQQEVAEKWSGRQTLSGPILRVPYTDYQTFVEDKVTKVLPRTEYAYFLPEKLEITGEVNPQILSRGIFDVVVYESQIQFKGRFNYPSFDAWDISEKDVHWHEAQLINGISDLRGIFNNLLLTLNGQELATEPGESLLPELPKSILSPVNLTEMSKEGLDFAYTIRLKGSENLQFIPIGKTTQVKVSGTWSAPSFDGAFLPATRSLSDSVFAADWQVFHYNRSYPQQSMGGFSNLNDSAFGLSLLMPIDQYQKSIRTAKYGILIIMLTFISLLLIEIMYKVRIHPFQYILIGCGLIIYYSLLLSLSEQIGFTYAYWIASVATVVLIGFYGRSFLPKSQTVWAFTGLLSLFYGFIFVITREEDYALLLGSVGLFLILGGIMFASRKIQWYKEKE
ncbi:cell envelope integrity protein CreD [Cytophagales bacterium LB-30]|uniref:Cell envelope integrity protein CreD n=1 Tax=Shiella aurantiaca TaxID=3058365 RepID=A0ABT8F3L7_9BACT|nr:cell envelope integrity protein CreD [Shiella aurantiaca]MDN4165052.1 cell envelope integrity protein CreD [Shiella aurantiaca]